MANQIATICRSSNVHRLSLEIPTRVNDEFDSSAFPPSTGPMFWLAGWLKMLSLKWRRLLSPSNTFFGFNLNKSKPQTNFLLNFFHFHCTLRILGLKKRSACSDIWYAYSSPGIQVFLLFFFCTLFVFSSYCPSFHILLCQCPNPSNRSARYQRCRTSLQLQVPPMLRERLTLCAAQLLLSLFLGRWVIR